MKDKTLSLLHSLQQYDIYFLAHIFVLCMPAPVVQSPMKFRDESEIKLLRVINR